MNQIKIHHFEPNDADGIAAIYNYYIKNSIATFEENPVSSNELLNRVSCVVSSNLPWLVAKSGEETSGYAYASKWQSRSAYRYTVGVSVYVDPKLTGFGIGSRLYSALFERLKSLKVHTAISGIALPNESSVELHEKFKMEKVAHFKEVGFKFNRWIDVGYWQVHF